MAEENVATQLVLHHACAIKAVAKTFQVPYGGLIISAGSLWGI